MQNSDSEPTTAKSGNFDLLIAIEALSKKFGTPFKMQGHKEQFIQYIEQNSALKEQIISHTEMSNRSTISLPKSITMPKQDIIPKQDPMTITQHFQSLNVSNKIEPPKSSGTYYSNEIIPHKKFLIDYMNARPNEKEKIVNLFARLFREFHFNKREDKDLILRHIR